MTTAELKEYLGMVVDVEKELYTQRTLEKTMQNKIEIFRQSQEITFENYCRMHGITERNFTPRKGKPIKPEKPAEAKESYDCIKWASDETEKISATKIIGILVASLLFPPIGLVCLGIWGYRKYQKEREIEKLRRDLGSMHRSAMKDYQKKIDQYNQDMEEYQKEKERCKQYREFCNEQWKQENEKIRHENEWCRNQAEPFRVILQNIREQENKTYTTCIKLYEKGNIYPRYCNYVAVCSFYDYIASGRCYSLDGPDGAYNKYDMEMRMDKISAQLNVVIKNLEAIRENQYMLYIEMKNAEEKIAALQKTVNQISDKMNVVIAGIGAVYAQGERNHSQLNARLQKIQSQTEELLKTSELAAYFEACNQRELHYMNRMNYLAGHYDNPYGNYSPV